MRAEPYGRFRPLPPEAQALLAEGRITDAVKFLQASRNLGLREARDWLDAHIASEPLLRAQLETLGRPGGARLFSASSCWMRWSPLASSTISGTCRANYPRGEFRCC
jgi:hypothetical protein